MDKLISIILPVYNEQGNIEGVVNHTLRFLSELVNNFEIIIVNDGSIDNTFKVLEDMSRKNHSIKVITHPKNFGYGAALTSGFKNAKFPLIFFMDADGQFSISEINKLISYVEDYDIIVGYRYNRKDSRYRVILGKVYSWLVFLLFGLKLKDVNCGFKLCKREILNLENICNSKSGVFYTEFLLKAKEKKYKIKEVPIAHFPRQKGRQTGASPKVIFNTVIDLIRLKHYLIRDRIKNWFFRKMNGNKQEEERE